MTNALKSQISESAIQKIQQRFQQVYGFSISPPVPIELETFSLMQRVHALANTFAHALAQRFDLEDRKTYREVIARLPEVVEGLPDMVQLIFPQMIVVWGLKRPQALEESLKGLQQLTALYTSEFAMRQFIVEYGEQERLWSFLQQLTQSSNPHHRRLASESTRPRLPWASHLPLTIAHPEKSLEMLQPLWEDSHPYVRKSVANHLNDQLKFNRNWTYQILQKWAKNPSPATQWIVKQALRNALKAGEWQAYQILGYPPAQAFTVQNWQWQVTQTEGGWQFGFQGEIRNNGHRALKLRLDWRLQWRTLAGKISEKTVKGLEANVEANAPLMFNKTLNLKGQAYQNLAEVMQVQLQVNGKINGKIIE